MPFSFRCPHCDHETLVDDALRGQSGPCAGCGRRVTLPRAPISAGQRPTRFRFLRALKLDPIFTVLIVVGVVLALVALALFPAYMRDGRDTRRLRCVANMKRIVTALRAYHRRYEQFPPPVVRDDKGQPRHSWRVLLLEELDLKNIRDAYRFDEPWDGPSNVNLVAKAPTVYQCPADIDAQLGGFTSYFLVVGPGTVIDYTQVETLGELADRAGNRVLIVERSNSEVRWLEPRDVDWRDYRPSIGEQGIARSAHPEGAHVALLSGRIEFLSSQMPSDKLLSMLTRGTSSR